MNLNYFQIKIVIAIIFYFLGNVIYSQTISLSTGSIAALITCEGTASSTRTFNISGAELNSDITVSIDNTTYTDIASSTIKGNSSSNS